MGCGIGFVEAVAVVRRGCDGPRRSGCRCGPRARFERPGDPTALRRRRDARARCGAVRGGRSRRALRGHPRRGVLRRSRGREPRVSPDPAPARSRLRSECARSAAGVRRGSSRRRDSTRSGVANNHAGDAGPHTVTDTIGALSRAGIVAVGGGSSAARAYEPRIVEVGHVRVALLAFDATGQGPRAGPRDAGRRLLERAAGARGGAARALGGGRRRGRHPRRHRVRAGHRSPRHAARAAGSPPGVRTSSGVRGRTSSSRSGSSTPATTAARRSSRPASATCSSTSTSPARSRGALLEVLAGADGVRAFRIGSVRATAPVQFLGWRLPQGDAAALGGEWWTLARPVRPARGEAPALARAASRARSSTRRSEIPKGTAAGSSSSPSGVPSARPTSARSCRGASSSTGTGSTAHVGLYRPRDLRPLWVAGTLLRPVAAVAACDGAIAVGYSTLNGERDRRHGRLALGRVRLPHAAGASRAAASRRARTSTVGSTRSCSKGAHDDRRTGSAPRSCSSLVAGLALAAAGCRSGKHSGATTTSPAKPSAFALPTSRGALRQLRGGAPAREQRAGVRRACDAALAERRARWCRRSARS